MTDDDIKDAAMEIQQMLLNGIVFGDLLNDAKARHLLGDILANEGMNELEARVLMAAADQFTRCIRTGMGVNQALAWMARSGWPDKIGNHIIQRLGAAHGTTR